METLILIGIVACVLFTAGTLFITQQIYRTLNKLRLPQPNEKQQENGQADTEKDYLKAIENAQDSNRVKIARHCFNRLPSSFALLDKLWEVQSIQISNSQDTHFTRNLIVDMNKAVAHYRQTCHIEHIDKPNFIIEALEIYSETVMKELREIEIKNLTKGIEQLRENVKILQTNSNDKKIIAEIERIDTGIDKTRLNAYKDLAKDYKEITEMLLKIYQTDSNDEEETKVKKVNEYNLMAIEQHKEALIKHTKDSEFLGDNNYNKGQKLYELTELIGGWDLRYLHSATTIYTNSIYGQIFSKLKPEAQLKITEMMIRADKKTL